MNALRVIVTGCAAAFGICAVFIAVTNISRLGWTGQGSMPWFFWISLLDNILIPAGGLFGMGAAFLLLVRIDRRLEQLQTTKAELK